MDITLDGQYRNQIDYIFVAEDGKALQSQKILDQELTMAQFMNSHCQIQTEIEGRESHQTIQI